MKTGREVVTDRGEATGGGVCGAGSGEGNPNAARRADTRIRPLPSGRPRSDNSNSIVGAMKVKGNKQEAAVGAEEGRRQEEADEESAARTLGKRDSDSSNETVR